MKTYLRLLGFAKPIGKFALPYFIFSVLSTIFGLINFTLIVPILRVLFGTADAKERASYTVTQKPEWNWDWNHIADYVVDTFNFYLSQAVTQSGELGALKFVCIVLVVSVFISNIFRYLSQAIMETLKVQLVNNLRNAVFKKVTSLHLGFFSEARKGDVMSRVTVDVQEVQFSISHTLIVLLKEPIALIGYFFILIKMSFSLTLFTLLVIPISGIVIGTISKRLKTYAAAGQLSLGRIITILDETLSGMRVVKGFNAEGFIRSKFVKENDIYTSLDRKSALRRELAPPISEFFGAMVIAAILLYGGSMVLSKQGDMDASTFVTYVVIFSQVLRPAKAMTNAFSNIQKGIVSGERIFQVLDTPPSVTDVPNAKMLSSFNDEISFQNVCFSYGEREVLKDISFTIKKGQTVALVGPSGGGKSTLADLIPRFYDVQSGSIRIDGVDVRELDAHSLRAKMGIVTQESVLFNDTIEQNIVFSSPFVSQEGVIAAAKVANAHEFIEQSEAGYQTIIGDRGMKLSGGQRQRLSIARAVYKNPEILILDEATSALDNESEKLVQDALNKLMRSRTSLVIAHRLSTIQNADLILVIDAGKIVEQGTHQELLAREGSFYRKLQSVHDNSF